jgi:hypothetical protein
MTYPSPFGPDPRAIEDFNKRANDYFDQKSRESNDPGYRPSDRPSGMPSNRGPFASADAAERWFERTGATKPRSSGPVPPGYTGFIFPDHEVGSDGFMTGKSIFDVLDMPSDLHPEDTFVWAIEDQSPMRNTTADAADRWNPRVIQMTLAGAVNWLRNLGSSSREDYNKIIGMLVAAGYVTPTEARYGGFTNEMAAAFLESVIDVHFTNQDEDTGAGKATTWFNHMDALAEGLSMSGQGLDGSGGGAGASLVRQDQWVDETTLQETVRNAARGILGRQLTEEETAAFVSEFRGMEQKWNDANWNAMNAEAGGEASSLTASPSPSSEAVSHVRGEFAQEKAGEDLGSYMGVLRRAVGLGEMGIGGEVG